MTLLVPFAFRGLCKRVAATYHKLRKEGTSSRSESNISSLERRQVKQRQPLVATTTSAVVTERDDRRPVRHRREVSLLSQSQRHQGKGRRPRCRTPRPSGPWD